MAREAKTNGTDANGTNGDGLSKAEKIRQKRLQRRQREKEKKSQSSASSSTPVPAEPATTEADEPVQYVSEEIDPDDLGEEFAFMKTKFASVEDLTKTRDKSVLDGEEGEGQTADGEEGKEGEEGAVIPVKQVKNAVSKRIDPKEPRKLSRREKKIKNRLSVAELKQLVVRPDVVEIHDVNAPDPKLLVTLKGYKDTVPVPKHWCQKRKYLGNKRGLDKPPFELPDFIAATGITKIRNAVLEKDAGKKMAQKMRDKAQPKMGRMDIDYQVLHDAIFKHQKKPANMSEHGEIYYEGKELELRMKSKVPGMMSDELMRALGMTHGSRSPPPWIYTMQKIGPPPSYPGMKIPGVSAPLPAGARWGYSEDEWGQPPLDTSGRPLWGDVFGKAVALEPHIEVKHWGIVEDEGEEEQQADEDEGQQDGDEDMGEEEQQQRQAVAAPVSVSAAAAKSLQLGQQAASGIDSVSSAASGLETPEAMSLRKKTDGTGTETPDTVRPPRQLYQVLEAQPVSVSSNALFGSTHTYVMPSQPSAATESERKRDERKKRAQGAVEASLAPEELENLDAELITRKYQQESAQVAATARVSGSAIAQADMDEVMDEQRAKKKRKVGDKKSGKDKGFDKFKF